MFSDFSLFSFAGCALLIALIIRRLLSNYRSSATATVKPSNQETTGRFRNVHVYYGSQTDTCKRMALHLGDPKKTPFKQLKNAITINDLKYFEPEILTTQTAATSDQLHLFLISTYTEGTAPDNAKWFMQWLEDSKFDFRVERDLLKNMRFAVFGVGNSVYEANYNTIAKKVDMWLAGLGAKRVWPLTLADVNNEDVEQAFHEWADAIVDQAEVFSNNNNVDYDSNADEEEEEGEEDNDKENNASDDGEIDVEDMGKLATKLQAAVQEKKNLRMRNLAKRQIGDQPNPDVKQSQPRSMVTPNLEKALTKQGYKIIGSHSGVKVCRWTKAMLRGRGGCYKHTFYGIASHQCMETTPSLACANKCVFCWRHHTNPVGTEWRWKVDPPEMILQGALDNHYRMIKQMRGVPGVSPERFEEGFNVRHCALSLVGEPIMYPHINEFVGMLHQRRISSFLVTNAQFPEKARFYAT